MILGFLLSWQIPLGLCYLESSAFLGGGGGGEEAAGNPEHSRLEAQEDSPVLTQPGLGFRKNHTMLSLPICYATLHLRSTNEETTPLSSHKYMTITDQNLAIRRRPGKRGRTSQDSTKLALTLIGSLAICGLGRTITCCRHWRTVRFLLCACQRASLPPGCARELAPCGLPSLAGPILSSPAVPPSSRGPRAPRWQRNPAGA